MNPQMNSPYGQQQQQPLPPVANQNQWPPNNLNNQMANMNLGPPKPAVQGPPGMPPSNNAFNNNNPNMMMPPTSNTPSSMHPGLSASNYGAPPMMMSNSNNNNINNNNSFQPPSNGFQNGAMANKMPPLANSLPAAVQQQQQQQQSIAPPLPPSSSIQNNGPPTMTSAATENSYLNSNALPPQQQQQQQSFPPTSSAPQNTMPPQQQQQPTSRPLPPTQQQQQQQGFNQQPPMPPMSAPQQQQQPPPQMHQQQIPPPQQNMSNASPFPMMPNPQQQQQQQQQSQMTNPGMMQAPPMMNMNTQMANPINQQPRFPPGQQLPPMNAAAPPNNYGMPSSLSQQPQLGQPNPNYPPQQQPGMPPMPPMGMGMRPPTQPGMYPQQQQPQQPGFQQPQQPGFQQPQQPGFQQPGGYPSGPMAAPASTQKRLDPDQMPNPIQVMAENQRSFGGVFSTAQIGQVPPLVTTKFITQDQGNSGPRYIRSTMYSIPANTDIMKQSAIPFALIISPFARLGDQEMAPPIVDFGEIGPIRCIRCKAYMSPHMQFIDAGRRFQCLLCKATTEVPAEYFQHLDHTGQRVDKYERPELVLGTYEFVATKDYCRNTTPPKPPAMIFIIDVSYNNMKSGLVHLLCSQMKRIIQNLPIDQGQTKTKMRVGFITYDKTVHFYNIKNTLAMPQQLVVGDINEMFMPLLDGFLADPEESEALIDQLMEQIPKMYGDTRETETILMPAIQAGLEALKASECAGKLLVFHSTLPVSEAPGQLKNRDDRKLLGTEKERTVLTPQNNSYNNLGQDCALAGCTVDLFVFNNSYIDLATIGQVSRLSGGEVFKYTYFQADIDGERLIVDIEKNISRPVAFDAVMRVRTSAGTRPTDFFGHFFMSNTTDMEIAGIDCDKSVAIEIKHDDKLSPEENVYVQVALLYTSCGGQRRLRVMNLALKTCTVLADLFRSCDLDTLILFLAKQGIFRLLEHTPKVFRDNLVNRAAQILACYRKHCASPTSAGQLILPECLKLLPLYISCLLKNDAFSGGSDITLDDRSYAMYFVSTMDLPTSVTFFYPRLIPIHNLESDDDDIAPIRCSIDKMTDDGAFILDNGVYMFMWLGIGLSSEFTQSVFGAQCTQQIDTERCGLPVFDNTLSKRVRGIVEKIQQGRTRCMRIALIRQRDKLESVLRHFLIEDRGTNGSDSYVDFLCYMHKEIRQLLS